MNWLLYYLAAGLGFAVTFTPQYAPDAIQKIARKGVKAPRWLLYGACWLYCCLLWPRPLFLIAQCIVADLRKGWRGG